MKSLTSGQPTENLVQPAWLWNFLGALANIGHAWSLFASSRSLQFTLFAFECLVLAAASTWAAWHFHDTAFYAGTGCSLWAFLFFMAIILEPQIISWMEKAGRGLREAWHWLVTLFGVFLFGVVLGLTPNKYRDEIE